MRGASVRPWEFLAVFLLVFFFASVLLFAIDFVPEPPKGSSVNVSLSATEVTGAIDAFASEVPAQSGAPSQAASPAAKPIASVSTTGDVLPTRVKVPSVNIDTVVVNPSSTDIKVLDDALMKGAARYPLSATLNEQASMLIFGHQSRLPIVQNKAFKAFAGLQNVKEGEEIIVYSATQEYHYRVVSVEHKSALDGLIEFSPNKRTLVLSTCDSFGERTDRYVVTAEFVSEKPIN